jgi:ferritin-like metal-binding protein YciE
MPKQERQESLQGIFLEEIQDLFDAEKQLVKALPKMAKSAEDGELENAFREHLEQTKNQVGRLEQVFEMLDSRARSKPCKGMRGIVEEGQEVISEGKPDAMIAGAARRVEHYEIAAYESASAIARELRMNDAVKLLQETLQEEIQADRMLAQISKRLVKGVESAPARERASSSGRKRGRSGSNFTTDHEEIRNWAEARGAHPACVKGTGGRGDTGMIRLDFPGYSGAESLQPISWDEWFNKFDRNNLALIYQEKTARGQRSNFNKLVNRETAEAGSRPKTRAAR